MGPWSSWAVYAPPCSRRAAGGRLTLLLRPAQASAWAAPAPAHREAAAGNGPVLLETMKRLHSLRRKARAEKSASAPAAGMAMGDATSAPSPSDYRFSSAAAKSAKTSRAAASSGQTATELAGSDCKICIYVRTSPGTVPRLCGPHGAVQPRPPCARRAQLWHGRRSPGSRRRAQVLERIKQGYQYLLPSICVEIWSKTQDTDSYGKCHNVLASLSVWGHNVRHWLQFGPCSAPAALSPVPSLTAAPCAGRSPQAATRRSRTAPWS